MCADTWRAVAFVGWDFCPCFRGEVPKGKPEWGGSGLY